MQQKMNLQTPCLTRCRTMLFAGAVSHREALLRAEQSRKAIEQKAVRSCPATGLQRGSIPNASSKNLHVTSHEPPVPLSSLATLIGSSAHAPHQTCSRHLSCQMAVFSTAESHKEVTWPSTQAAAAAQAKAVAKERDDLRALNEQVMRNQAALRQHNTALQEEKGRAAAQVQDLQEQVLLCGRLRAVCTQPHAQ